MGDEAYSPAVDPLIGARVGEYEILEPIGEGGMGVVYRGVHPVIKKRVAVKILKPQIAAEAVQVRRLLTEAEAVNAIRHRGIIDIFSMGTLPDGRPYVVMELLDGEALDLWLQKLPGGRVSLPMAVELLLGMCGPLAAAHRANVIHRDLKPSNIFVCTQSDGTRFVKLLDFGLAKRAVAIDGSSRQTSQATVAGTPDYMAPEQARGLDVSPRSDLYSLGVIAFELLTGKVPFTGATPMDVMVAHVSAAPVEPSALEPLLPGALNQLVLRLLSRSARRPWRRCATCWRRCWSSSASRAPAPLARFRPTSLPRPPRRCRWPCPPRRNRTIIRTTAIRRSIPTRPPRPAPRRSWRACRSRT